MTTSRLIRTPDGYRRFTPDGEPLYHGDDRSYQHIHSGIARDATRWTHATVYRSRLGRYACRLWHRTRWQGEQETSIWLVAETAAALLVLLRERELLEEWVDDIAASLADADLTTIDEV